MRSSSSEPRILGSATNVASVRLMEYRKLSSEPTKFPKDKLQVQGSRGPHCFPQQLWRWFGPTHLKKGIEPQGEQHR